jgi:hypothetical protein
MKREIVVVVGTALIWGLVIVACAVALRGSGAFKEIQHILGGGAAVSLLILAAGIMKRAPSA